MSEDWYRRVIRALLAEVRTLTNDLEWIAGGEDDCGCESTSSARYALEHREQAGQ